MQKLDSLIERITRRMGPDLLALLAQRPEMSAALEEIQLERFVQNAETLEKGE